MRQWWKSKSLETKICIMVIFVSQALPGFYIRGVLINQCDFWVCGLFLYVSIKHGIHIKKTPTIFFAFCAFGLAAILSVLVAEIQSEQWNLIPILRACRLFLAPMILYIMTEWSEKLDFVAVIDSCIIGGIVAAAFAVVMFFLQYPPFCAQQMLTIGEQCILRAGGITNNSSSFGAQMSLLFALSGGCLYFCQEYKKDGIYIAGIAASIIGSFYSFSRTPWLVVLACLGILLILYHDKKAVSVVVVSILCIIVIFVGNILSGYSQLILGRLSPAAPEFPNESIHTEYSSGRSEEIAKKAAQYARNPQYYLTGSGFDVIREGISYTCDCQYATALLSMGILGIGALLSCYCVWLSMVIKPWRTQSFFWLQCLLVGMWHALTALTADAMCFSVSMVVVAAVLAAKQYNKCIVENKN